MATVVTCLTSCGERDGLSSISGDYSVVSLLAPHSLERVPMQVAINFRCPGCYKFEPAIETLRARYGNRLVIDVIAVTTSGSTGLPERFYLLSKHTGKGDLARSALYKAYFEQKLDIDSPMTIRHLAHEIGLDSSSLAEIGSPDLIQQQQRIDAEAHIFALYTPGVLIDRQLLVKPDPAAVAVLVDELLTHHKSISTP